MSSTSIRVSGPLALGTVLVASLMSLALASEPKNGLREKEAVLRKLLKTAIAADGSLPAHFLRLVFHDAYTFDAKTKKGGCNGSIRFELGRPENRGLDHPIKVLHVLQKQTGLSWGDVTAIAGAVGVEAAGGPVILLELGRKQSDVADLSGILPSPRSDLTTLRTSFNGHGFSDLDLVSLSGGHTLGAALGRKFVSHSTRFTNDYYKNLAWFIERKEQGKPTLDGPPETPNLQLPSDLALITDTHTKNIVLMFASFEQSFFHCFRGAYRKLVDSGF